MYQIQTYIKNRNGLLLEKWWMNNQRDFGIEEIVAFQTETAKGVVELVREMIKNEKERHEPAYEPEDHHIRSCTLTY